jgi:phage/plasmid-like protein (TIGR03299 family)
VCDNTLSIARGEKGQQYKVKHTSKSLSRIADARSALNIVYSMADDFAAEVKELCETTVTDKQWNAFLKEIAPLPEDPKQVRGRTMAENKIAEFTRLWRHDERVSPWKGTAYGVLAAVNTYDHHIAITRGMDRAERNMDKAVTGHFDKLDTATLDTLNKVLATV